VVSGVAFSRVFVTDDAIELSSTKRALKHLGSPRVIGIRTAEDVPPEHRGSNTLVITGRGERILARCPKARDSFCCNYLSLGVFGCAQPGTGQTLMVCADSGPSISAVHRTSQRNPTAMIRLGLSLTEDSRPLDRAFGFTEKFIDAFAALPNVYFEVTAGMDQLDRFLGLPAKGKAVIKVPVNAPSVLGGDAASGDLLSKRLKAAWKAVDAGYFISIHIEPICRFPGWDEEYAAVMESLCAFPAERVAWVSLGSDAAAPACKRRSDVYGLLLDKLQAMGLRRIYFCRESASLWRKVYRELPLNLPDICDIFKPIAGIPIRREKPP
jgi:spore photoproduct lyase